MDNQGQNPNATAQDSPLQQQVSSTGKEGEAIAAVSQEKWMQETAPEAKLLEEMKEAGVEATRGEVLSVAPELASQGVVPVGIATPLPTNPSVHFPMTEEKAESIVKMHKKIKDSIYWLAMLIVRQFKVLQVKQKEVV